MNKKKMAEFTAMANESKCCILLLDDGNDYAQGIQGKAIDLALLLAVSMKKCPQLVSVVEDALDAYKNVKDETTNS